MKRQGTSNWKRIAMMTGVTALVISSVFTAIVQPGVRTRRSGTLLATQAMAQEAESAAPAAPEAAAERLSPQFGGEAQTTASLRIFESDPLAARAELLKKKELELAAREKALKEKEAHLETLRRETAANLAKIEDLYKKLEQKSAQAQQQREKDIAKWRSIYQSMPAEKAGPIIQGLDTEFALELLSQMDPKKAGKILSAVDPQKAVELAKRLGNKKP